MENKDLLLIIALGILLICPVIGCLGGKEGLSSNVDCPDGYICTLKPKSAMETRQEGLQKQLSQAKFALAQIQGHELQALHKGSACSAEPQLCATESGEYTCLPGWPQGTPVKCLGGGKVACASNDGQSCFWGTCGADGNVDPTNQAYYTRPGTGEEGIGRARWKIGGNNPASADCPGWKRPSDGKTACDILVEEGQGTKGGGEGFIKDFFDSTGTRQLPPAICKTKCAETAGCKFYSTRMNDMGGCMLFSSCDNPDSEGGLNAYNTWSMDPDSKDAQNILVIEATIASIEKEIDALKLDDACEKVIKECRATKIKQNNFTMQLDNIMGQYKAMMPDVACTGPTCDTSQPTKLQCTGCDPAIIAQNLGEQYRNDPNICKSRANTTQCTQAGGQWTAGR